MGLAFSLGSRFRHGEMDLVFDSRDHPITHGLRVLHLPTKRIGRCAAISRV